MLPDWNIPWAGIGALLAGCGSLLSGWAAYKMATRNNHESKAESSSDDH